MQACHSPILHDGTDQCSGNALTDNFFKDVGITQNQFNVGQQLLSLGIILLEVCLVYLSLGIDTDKI